METIRFNIGDTCWLNDHKFIIDKFVTSEKVIIRDESTNDIKLAYIRTLTKKESEVETSINHIDSISDEDWKVAQHRFSLIVEIDSLINLNPDYNTSQAVEIISKKHRVSSRTLYRWKKVYDNYPHISGLIPNKSSGGRGKGRIDKIQENIISEILEFYFSNQRPTVSRTYRELLLRFRKENISPVSLNTLRSRISKESIIKAYGSRYGKGVMKQKTNSVPGSYPEVNSPLEVIQIDHTPMDVIVVDEVSRNPIGRPWLTLAIDIYSRMVAGFYISFDSPGTLGTGIVIAEAMLPKDPIISKFDLKSDWPIHGKIQNIHTDNAPEFKSKSLLISCEEWGINLNYRPKGETHWGGHIERLLGSFLKELHNIPGTTFSDIKSRGDYKSTKEAVLTLNELEKWLSLYIVDIYHNSIHSSLSMSPLRKYYHGLNSFETKLPSGQGDYKFDAIKIKLDFLPTEERTVQRTGVQIDHIRYFADILRPYVYANEINDNLVTTKKRTPLKLKFKRDPRDLSCIYFLEPKLNKYFPIYYADASKPPISIWEHREALKELKRKGKVDKITEDLIFETHENLKKIIETAKTEKKKAKIEERHRKSKEYIKREIEVKPSSINNEENPNVELDFNNIDFFTFNDEL